MTVAPLAQDALMLARWQFGITTVYHFILVPLTIGLSFMVAIMQSKWRRTGSETWLKATRFFGKLFLINFALGVATGIVQEFQFGMNWSEYSRFVGDIFGAPLAVEALLSFFMESTFMGLWIFGWGKLSAKIHTLCIWMVALGVNTSALWIVGANSWMQHPVGAVFQPETGRAALAADGVPSAMGFFLVLLNPTFWLAIWHVITSAWMLSGTFIAGIALWWMVRAARAGAEDKARDVWRPIARFGLWFVVIGGLLTALSGHFQAQHIAVEQPMKMAAGEALCQTTNEAPFALAAFGSDCDSLTTVGEVPYVLSFLATNSLSGEVTGINEANVLYGNLAGKEALPDAQADSYMPPLMATFWSFRLMIIFGLFSAVLAIWGLIATAKGKISKSQGLAKFAVISLPMPFLAASFGWIYTEIGRQPWIVVPNLSELDRGVYQLTQNAVSSNVSAFSVGASMVIFTLLYLGLGIIWFLLMKRYVKEGMHIAPKADAREDDHALSFSY